MYFIHLFAFLFCLHVFLCLWCLCLVFCSALYFWTFLLTFQFFSICLLFKSTLCPFTVFVYAFYLFRNPIITVSSYSEYPVLYCLFIQFIFISLFRFIDELLVFTLLNFDFAPHFTSHSFTLLSHFTFLYFYFICSNFNFLNYFK